MRADHVEKQVEAIVKCQVHDVIDLSADIAWMPIQMDTEEESNDKENEVKPMVEPSRTLSFWERMKRLSPHRLY